jgi:hypothetical protein
MRVPATVVAVPGAAAVVSDVPFFSDVHDKEATTKLTKSTKGLMSDSISPAVSPRKD